MRKGFRQGNICVGRVPCVVVGSDENDTIICVHGFSKINYKLFTYSEVGVIAL